MIVVLDGALRTVALAEARAARTSSRPTPYLNSAARIEFDAHRRQALPPTSTFADALHLRRRCWHSRWRPRHRADLACAWRGHGAITMIGDIAGLILVIGSGWSEDGGPDRHRAALMAAARSRARAVDVAVEPELQRRACCRASRRGSFPLTSAIWPQVCSRAAKRRWRPYCRGWAPGTSLAPEYGENRTWAAAETEQAKSEAAGQRNADGQQRRSPRAFE